MSKYTDFCISPELFFFLIRVVPVSCSCLISVPWWNRFFPWRLFGSNMEMDNDRTHASVGSVPSMTSQRLEPLPFNSFQQVYWEYRWAWFINKWEVLEKCTYFQPQRHPEGMRREENRRFNEILSNLHFILQIWKNAQNWSVLSLRLVSG